jgi:hypothetical protein
MKAGKNIAALQLTARFTSYSGTSKASAILAVNAEIATDVMQISQLSRDCAKRIAQRFL